MKNASCGSNWRACSRSTATSTSRSRPCSTHRAPTSCRCSGSRNASSFCAIASPISRTSSLRTSSPERASGGGWRAGKRRRRLATEPPRPLRAIRLPLLRLDSGFVDDLAPALRLDAFELREILRRAAAGQYIKLTEARLGRGLLDDRVDGAVELGDDRRGRLRRRADRVPGIGNEPRQPD